MRHACDATLRCQASRHWRRSRWRSRSGEVRLTIVTRSGEVSKPDRPPRCHAAAGYRPGPVCARSSPAQARGPADPAAGPGGAAHVLGSGAVRAARHAQSRGEFDHGHARRPAPSHPYRYDRLVGARAADRPAAPGAALPHADPELLARRSTPDAALPQLAAGPVRQLPGARSSSRSETREFTVEVDLVAEMAVINPFDFFVEPTRRDFPFAYEPALAKELAPYLRARAGRARCSRAWLDSDRTRANRRIVDFLVDLNQRPAAATIGYVDPHGAGRPDAARRRWRSARGSCRDSAWLLVQILRHLGLAARFVSGYLIQLKPDVKSLDGPSGAEQDFTDLHAWAEVYLPGAGWIGLDPTSGLLAGEGHIPLACTPRPAAAPPRSPVRVDPCEVEFDFDDERARASTRTPRVTKPYTEEQWQEIAGRRPRSRRAPAGRRRAPDHGRRADLRLDRRHGRRGVEHGRASGPTKRALRRRPDPPAARPLRAGRPAALRPGQMVSRRAAAALGLRALLARRRRAAVAQPGADRRRDRRRGRRPWPTPSGSCSALAERLGLDAGLRHAGLRGPGLLRAEASSSCRSNVDPADNKLDDPVERARLARVFERGLDEPVGYVLPIQRWQAREPVGAGAASAGSLRRGTPVPGAGRLAGGLPPAAGLAALGAAGRLPARAAARPVRRARRRCRRRDAACCSRGVGRRRRRPTRRRRRSELGAGPHGPGRRAARRPAVRLHAAARRCAEDYRRRWSPRSRRPPPTCDMPVLLEGYAPPADPRLNVIKVTPDPGVIEVNIHPSPQLGRAGRDHRRRSTRRRAQSRLGTEKFMLDGRHAGTGGGNHVVLGGATPADSPFLRRPDLLRIAGRLLAEPPVALLPVLRPVHRPDQPGAARRRGARTTSSTSWRSRCAQIPEPGGGDLPALAGRPALPQPAGRRHRQHAPRRDLHRQALLARRPDRPARAWSSSAPSRCRRTRA